jgi:hypothetical protein
VLLFGFVEENGGRPFVGNNVTKGQTVIIHQGNAGDHVLYYDSSSSLVAKDVIKDDFGGKLPSGRPFRPDVRGRRPDVRPRPHLSCGRDFTRGRVFTVRRRGKNRVRADAGACPRGWASERTRKKILKNIFLFFLF